MNYEEGETSAYFYKKRRMNSNLFRLMIVGCACVSLSAQAQTSSVSTVSHTWVSDLGNGQYKNPVLYADYSDPDACATPEGDFLLTASSFNYAPGLPILRSRDLVNWRIVNYALPVQHPDTVFNKPMWGKGVWAPSIRYHQGMYYIFWGDPDYGIYMIKTDNPEGKWSAPVLVKAGKGLIDPTPLWDEDGRVYMVHAYAGSRSSINSMVVVCELSKEADKVISGSVMVYDGNDGTNHTIEGPKFYKRNGYYYIFAPAGGVTKGWQLVLRSKNVYGPYEPKIVMRQGNTKINGPHQGAWITTPKGEDWFLHFQDRKAYGRVLWLNPVEWKKDWPVIGVDKDGDGCGEPVEQYRKPKVDGKSPVYTPAESDEFNDERLGLQWQWNANPQEGYGYPTRMGFFRMYAVPMAVGSVDLHSSPAVLTQKFPAETFTATMKMKFTAKQDGEEAGLAVMGSSYSTLALRKEGDKFLFQQTLFKDVEKTVASDESRAERTVKTIASFPALRLRMPGVPDNEYREIQLRVRIFPGAAVEFSYSTDGGKRFQKAGVKFQAVKELWTGAKIGMYCTTPHKIGGKLRGWMDVDWFRMTK